MSQPICTLETDKYYTGVDEPEEREKTSWLAVVGAFMAMLSVLVWARSLRFGRQALPHIIFASADFSYLAHRFSTTFLLVAPAAVILSIIVAAYGLGDARRSWLRRAAVLATLTVSCLTAWVLLARLTETPMRLY